MTREFLNETQERFLKGILAQLPIAQVAELYLFQPIKQGGVESGVAVIAGVPEAPVPEPGDAGDVAPESAHDAAGETAGDAGDVAPEGETDAELEVLEHAGAGAELGVVDADEAATDREVDEDDAGDVDEEDVDEDDADGDDVDEDDVDADEDGFADEELEEGDTDAATTEDAAAHRFIVYTAHYRYVLKGPDRGKWALDLKAEADAPLLTIETVVRGVQQRAGDVEPPRRYDQGEVRQLLRLPAEDVPAP